jgi:hypothetical protein
VGTRPPRVRPPRVLGTREIGGAGLGAGRTRGRSRHLLYSTPTTAPTTAPSSVIKTRTAKSIPHRASATSAATTSGRCRACCRTDAFWTGSRMTVTDPRGCESFPPSRRFTMTPRNRSPSCEERLASPSRASNRGSWSRRPTSKRRRGAAAAVATLSNWLPSSTRKSLSLDRQIQDVDPGVCPQEAQRRRNPDYFKMDALRPQP